MNRFREIIFLGIYHPDLFLNFIPTFPLVRPSVGCQANLSVGYLQDTWCRKFFKFCSNLHRAFYDISPLLYQQTHRIKYT